MTNSTSRFLSKRKTGVFITQLLVIAFLFANLLSVNAEKTASASLANYSSYISPFCNNGFSNSFLNWSGYPSGTYGKVVGNLWASTNIYVSWYIYTGYSLDDTNSTGNLLVQNQFSQTGLSYQEIGDHYGGFLSNGHVTTNTNTVTC